MELVDERFSRLSHFSWTRRLQRQREGQGLGREGAGTEGAGGRAVSEATGTVGGGGDCVATRFHGLGEKAKASGGAEHVPVAGVEQEDEQKHYSVRHNC